MKKISTDHVRIGMKIVKLDESWLATPFFKHCFIVKDQKKLQQLRTACKFVYVAVDDSPHLTSSDISSSKQNGTDVSRSAAKAEVLISTKILSSVYDDLEQSQTLNTQSVRMVVNNLTIQILADSTTFLQLANIQDKEPSLAKKSIRVLILYIAFSKFLGIEKSKLFNIGIAALLHDLGMILQSLPLAESRELTKTEKETLHCHSKDGAEVLRQTNEFSPLVLKIIEAHHEYYDGTGYPLGLSKRNINLYSRMLTVVCTYEALTRDRGYKKAVSPLIAVQELLRLSGTMLDPRLVERFINMVGFSSSTKH